MCRRMFIQGMLWQGMLGWGIQGVLGGQEFTALALSRSATVSRGEQHPWAWPARLRPLPCGPVTSLGSAFPHRQLPRGSESSLSLPPAAPGMEEN